MSNADTKRGINHVSRISHEVLHVLDRTRVLGVENNECCETQNKFNCHNLLRPHGVEGKSQLVVCV